LKSQAQGYGYEKNYNPPHEFFRRRIKSCERDISPTSTGGKPGELIGEIGSVLLGPVVWLDGGSDGF